MNGVIIIDKPSGWTSHDVVNRMRRILQQRSIGHLGTLDPLATGVLPLVTGSLTRLAQFYLASEKTYEGVIRFGFATNTYDADGDPLDEVPPRVGNHVGTPAHVGTAALACPERSRRGCPAPIPDLDLTSLQTLAAEFVGQIEQTPPPFSAKKIQGVPAYKLARKQKEVTLQPVQVEIKEFTITAIEDDRAHFRARVSSGTYMRSIAHEMGRRLGCGAHLASLRRTSVAEFDITQAHTIEAIEGRQHFEAQIRSADSDFTGICHSDRSSAFPQEKGSEVEEPAVVADGDPCPPISPQQQHSTEPQSSLGLKTPRLQPLFIHPRQLLPQFPSVTADEPTAARIRSGRPINLPELSRARQVKVFASQSDLLAIATRVAGTLFHPKIVFPRD